MIAAYNHETEVDYNICKDYELPIGVGTQYHRAR
jgi:hypothetical protein